MAERIAYLEAVVGADITAFRRGMSEIRNEVGILSETMGGLGRLGRNLTFTVTAPLTTLGTFAVQTAGTFEASMQNINAIAQMTGDELDSLSQRVLDFGKNTRSGAGVASEALYTVFSAGLTDVEEAFATMEVASKTAEAGLADVTVTTEALVASMLSYGNTTEEFANRASDALTQMVAIGVGSMQDFANAVGKVLPSAQAVGMTIEELYGNMAFLTQRGLSAAKASTSLNAALTSLAKPTNAMQAAFRELGVSGAEELVTKFGSINAGLKELILTTDGTQQEIQALFNNIRGARAINQFANNIGQWESSMEDFNASVEGATLRAYEQQMDSFMAKWDKMTSALEAAAIVIGQSLFPIVEPVIELFTDLLLSITEINPELLGLGAAAAVAAAAFPPLLWLTASLATPVGILSSAFVTLGSILGGTVVNALDDFAESSAGAQNSIRQFLLAAEELTGLDLAVPELSDATSQFQQDSDLLSGSAVYTQTIGTEIKVESPKSLWQIYEENGYDDMFSWDEFMEKATDGNWDGGAITPDNPLRLDTGEVALRGNPLELIESQMGNVLEGARNYWNDWRWEQMTFWEKVEYRIEEGYPRFRSAFSNLMGEFSDWAAPRIMEAMNAVGNWLDGASLDGLYNAIYSLLNGDLSGAVDAVIPGLGTTIENELSALFSEIDLSGVRASGENMLSRAFDFLTEDAIPNLSRITGLVAGSVVTALTSAFELAGNFLSGTDTGDLGDSAMSAFNQTIGDGFSQGFADGSGGLGIVDAVTELLSAAADTIVNEAVPIFFGLAGRLVGALGTAIRQGFSQAGAVITGENPNLGDSVLQPFVEGLNAGMGDAGIEDAGIAESIITALAGSIAIGAVVAPATTWAIATSGIQMGVQLAMGGINWAFGTVASAVTSGISSAVASSATASAFAGAVTSIKTAFTTALAGMGVLTVGVSLTLLVWEYIIPSDTKLQAQDAMANFMDGLVGQEGATADLRASVWRAMGDEDRAAYWQAIADGGMVDEAGNVTIKPTGLEFDWSFADGDNVIPYFSELLDMDRTTSRDMVQDVLDDVIPEVDLSRSFDFSKQTDLIDAAEVMSDLLYWGNQDFMDTEFRQFAGIVVEDFANSIREETGNHSLTTQEILDSILETESSTVIDLSALNLEITGSGLTTTGGGWLDDVTDNLIGGDLALDDTIRTEVENSLNNLEITPDMQASVSDFTSRVLSSGGVDSEGNFTAAPFLENFLNPLNTAWVNTFGAGGTMTMAFTVFQTTVSDSMLLVQESVLGLSTTVPVMAAWAATAFGSMMTVKLGVDMLNSSIDRLIGSLHELGSVNVSPTVNMPHIQPISVHNPGGTNTDSRGNGGSFNVNNSSSSNGQPQTAQTRVANVYGLSSAQEIVDELERNGYSVNRR